MFTKGGLVLFAYQPATLSGDPVAALINTCLLEERAGAEAFGYTAPDGVAYSLKWAFHNDARLVFVAVYQRALALTYVDQLLASVRKAFTQQHYQPQVRRSSSSGATPVPCHLTPFLRTTTSATRLPRLPCGLCQAAGGGGDQGCGGEAAEGEQQHTRGCREAGARLLHAGGDSRTARRWRRRGCLR